ncbi:hypothetical protein MBLNU230_g1743t1 [Neophaeotheca triangularis]
MATNVDDLFKRPNAPMTNGKRKYEEPNAQQAYKATKLTSDDSPNASGPNGASVEDEEDVEAGPELPPDEEGDDEEGRFFGGGVTKNTTDALDYLEENDAGAYREERIDAAWLKGLGAKFQKKVAKNAELRSKHESDPQKFMASEADLDAEVKSFSVLTEHPELYSTLAESESVANLVGLLAHDNTDIAIAAIEIISELLDEDVEAEQEQWDALVSAFLDSDLMDLLLSNFDRLDENEESDRSGVYHSLAVLEALVSQQTIAERIGTEKLLNWLCERMQRPERPLGQNKQYAAEVLQVMLQTSPLLRQRLATEIEGVDLFLQLLAPYRKRDPPKPSYEEEHFENVFDALTCVVDEPPGKKAFVESEGVELALMMLKDGSMSKQRALRLLDHAAGGTEGATQVCEKLVDEAGLKPLFKQFMKAHNDSTTTEHLLGIFSSLLRQLPGETPQRIRTLAKFSEKDYEKTTKLCKLRQEYARRLGAVEAEVNKERATIEDPEEAEMREPEWLSRRMDGGLFSLRTLDVVLAWLAAEDAGAKSRLQAQVDLAAVRASLEEQMEGLEDDGEEGETKEMLGTLASFLEVNL